MTFAHWFSQAKWAPSVIDGWLKPLLPCSCRAYPWAKHNTPSSTGRCTVATNNAKCMNQLLCSYYCISWEYVHYGINVYDCIGIVKQIALRESIKCIPITIPNQILCFLTGQNVLNVIFQKVLTKWSIWSNLILLYHQHHHLVLFYICLKKAFEPKCCCFIFNFYIRQLSSLFPFISL